MAVCTCKPFLVPSGLNTMMCKSMLAFLVVDKHINLLGAGQMSIHKGGFSEVTHICIYLLTCHNMDVGVATPFL